MTTLTPPASFRLAPDVFDRLRALVQWVEATPACINLPDRVWEQIHDQLLDPFDNDVLPDPWHAVVVQFENETTAAVGGTNPGDFVVLVSHEEDESTEFHIRIERAERAEQATHE